MVMASLQVPLGHTLLCTPAGDTEPAHDTPGPALSACVCLSTGKESFRHTLVDPLSSHAEPCERASRLP